MWGQIEGKTKISIAKETLSSIVNGWSGGQVGLMVYGHRSKGACDDIELVLPVGSLNAQAMKNSIEAITPKGKTPMTDSVKRAAAILKYNEGPATVVLISDGEETCNLDPCEAATELEKLGVNFTIHVVGFDLNNAGRQARQQLQCLAQNTGGKFVEASSATQLLSALKEVIDEPSSLPIPTVVPASTATPQPTTAPTPKPTTVAIKENFRARAVLMEGGKPLESGVSWSLKTPSLSGDGEQIAQSYDDTFVKQVPPGNYTLVVRSGEVTIKKDITIASELTDIVVTLNAGYLTSKAFVSGQNEELTDGLSWKVSAPGDEEQIANSYKENPRWLVPAGEYDLSVRWGKAAAKTAVSVIPGENTDTSITLSAGVLSLKTFAVEGGEQISNGLSYTVYEGKSTLSGQRNVIDSSYNATPEFRLPAQKYLVTVKWGQAKTEPIEVEIPSNERVERSLIVNAGVIDVSFTTTKPYEHRTWEIFNAVKKLDGTRDSITSSYKEEDSFILPAGTYKVKLKLGDRVIEQEALVKAGERKEVVLVEQE